MPKTTIQEPEYEIQASPAKLARFVELRRQRDEQERARALNWQPKNRPPLEPHQIPPAGDWNLWLLEGGRGCGKTEACSRYFARYMRANPGHRGRIIAPTFGDAVEACIQGPSGLLTIDPEIQWLPSSPGGAKVVWGNGAEALVFGTPNPRDVDRLRAGGNRHCFTADTPILTQHGLRPIASVKADDQVWTREGLRRVRRAGRTGVRPTWRLQTAAGRSITGTFDHPILTPTGWRHLGSVLPDDMLHTWRESSFGTDGDGTSAKTRPMCGGTSRLALDRVRAVWPTGRVEPVYDLQVEGCREFVAGGLIVHNCDWWEELAANPQLRKAWDQAALGLRLGDRPHSIASTTPRGTRDYREIRGLPDVAMTHATLFDNPHNPPEWVARMRARYEGTTLGQQELLGLLLDDVQGALWTRAMFDDHRVDQAPMLMRVTVAIDPSVTSGERADDTGIIVAGVAELNGVLHGYVLADQTCHLPPDGWAKAAISAYHAYAADLVVGEVNNGGELVHAVLKTQDDRVPFKAVHASRGKRVRADPIAALYQQGRVHHVGGLASLEDECCLWVPGESTDSPDRMDALVWALTELMLAGGPAQLLVPSSTQSGQRQLSGRGRW